MSVEFVKETMRLKQVNWLMAIVLAMVPTASALAQSTKPVDPVMQQLVGQWRTGFKAGDPVSVIGSLGFMFTPNGKAIMFYGSPAGLMTASLEYAIDSKPKPMHLDLKIAVLEKPVFTIFDLPDAQTLKLQIEGTDPGKPRPQAFNKEEQFRKVSDTTIVPLTELAQLEQTEAGEGEWLMKSISTSALLYRIANNQFPTSPEQLGLRHSETKNYRVQLSTTPQQLTLFARAKKAGLKSYIGVVRHDVVKEQEKAQEFGLATICQTFHPSLIAPPPPMIRRPDDVLFGSYAVQCGSGSEKV